MTRHNIYTYVMAHENALMRNGEWECETAGCAGREIVPCGKEVSRLETFDRCVLQDI